MKKQTLNRAIKKAGSQVELAKILGFSKQMMYQVRKGIRPLSKDRTILLNQFLEGS
jgi:DNA-binding transcriptional regulator YdaS (Cro superfamily)